jgi:hypothetical protein
LLATIRFRVFCFPAYTLGIKVKIYKTTIFLYGCETRSLTLREEHRLRVFENRVLRRIFRPKRDEETEEWRKLCSEELHNLYCSQNLSQIKSRKIICLGHGVHMTEVHGFGGKTQRKETTWKTKA